MGFGDNVIVTNAAPGTYSGASSLTGTIFQIGNVPGGIIYGAEKLLFIFKITAIATGGTILVDTSIDGVNFTSGGFVGSVAVAAVKNYAMSWVNVPLSFLLFSWSFGASTDSFTLAGIDIMGTNT